MRQATEDSVVGRLPGDADFNAFALELFSLQFDAVSPYREFCKTRGQTPASVQHWREIPTVSTNAFKSLPITSLPPAEREGAFYSSGTTSADRSVHWHNAESLQLYEEVCRLWFRPHLLPEVRMNEPPNRAPPSREAAIPMLLLMPDQASAPSSSLVRMAETVRQAWGAPDSIATGRINDDGLWTLDETATVDYLRRAETPILILATAFSLVELIDYLAQIGRRITLPFGSRLMETGGYKGRVRNLSKEALYEAVDRYLGISQSHIICEYGMSELTSQAYDHIAGKAPPSLSERLFYWPPWTRARIVSPDRGTSVPHGEEGLVEIYDLANVRSVMAIQTQDIGCIQEGGLRLSGRASDAEPKGCSLMSP